METDFVLRNKETHERQCSLLNDDPDASKEYGICRNTILNQLRYIHTVNHSNNSNNKLLPLFIDISMSVMVGLCQI